MYRCLAKLGAIGVGGVFPATYVLSLVGFTSAGVAAGSMAASVQSMFGGTVPAWFSALQSAGAAGVGVKSALGSFLAAASCICECD